MDDTGDQGGSPARCYSQRAALIIVAGLAVVEAVVVLAIVTRTVEFNSAALAGSGYFYVSTVRLAPVLRVLAVAPPVLLLAWVATRTIDRWEGPTVAAVTVCSVLGQVRLQGVNSASLQFVDSEANPFFELARHKSFSNILRHYVRDANSLSMHARSNMPGKTLLYSVLQTISTNPRVLGYVVIALSGAGALLVYLVCRRIFPGRRTALYAIILYVFLPSRLFFVPTSLNTVTPVFILAVVWIFLCWCDHPRRGLLVLLGVTVYLTLLFEPTPLIMLLALVPLTLRASRSKHLAATNLIELVILPALTLLAVHLLFVWLFGFNLFTAFLHVWNDAHRVNRELKRPYAGWLLPNLRELLINSGIGISLLALLRFASIGTTEDGRRSRGVLGAGDALALGVVPTVVLLDLLGVNRGEVTRLWIFVGVLLCILAADQCARLPLWVFLVLLTGTMLQTALEVSTISFAVFFGPTIMTHNEPFVDVTLVAALTAIGAYGVTAIRGHRAATHLITGIENQSER
jgi:hypothetical protein